MRAKLTIWLAIVLAALLAVVLAVGYRVRISSKAAPAATSTWTVVTIGAMVLVPSGTFAMGNCSGPVQPTLIARATALVKRKDQPPVLDDNPDELPVHAVIVGAFYMDKYLVTKEKWDEVYTWATGHGYAFDNPGEGKASDHPVQTVTWYDCVKWCNARSEMEGRTPCYYTASNLVATNIYRMGTNVIQHSWVNWNTNGYRLPTEAEWEKAARGGLAGCRFPWGDTISHERANYFSNPSIRYDKSWTRGWHPRFFNGKEPYTSPVGSFDPNGYGLYDMAGNVSEWCWDWYDDGYYARSPGSDPRGPASGACRVLRGGLWYSHAYFTRCADRSLSHPDYNDVLIGFRCARGL